MPGSFTNYGRNKVQDKVFGGTEFSPPSLYLAPFVTMADPNGPGAEPSGSQRASVPPSIWLSSTAQMTQNLDDIKLPRSGNRQGDIIGLGVFDSSVGGNCISYFPAEDGMLIETNDSLVVLAGGLVHRWQPGCYSNWLKNQVLNHIYKGIPMPAFPVLDSVYFTSAPSDIAAGTMPNVGGFLAQPYANNASNFAASVGGLKENSTRIEFPVVTAAQGTTNWFGFMVGSQLLSYAELDSAKSMAINTQLIIEPGDIEFRLV